MCSPELHKEWSSAYDAYESNELEQSPAGNRDLLAGFQDAFFHLPKDHMSHRTTESQQCT